LVAPTPIGVWLSANIRPASLVRSKGGMLKFSQNAGWCSRRYVVPVVESTKVLQAGLVVAQASPGIHRIDGVTTIHL
jgi:hypothetical protein